MEPTRRIEALGSHFANISAVDLEEKIPDDVMTNIRQMEDKAYEKEGADSAVGESHCSFLLRSYVVLNNFNSVIMDLCCPYVTLAKVRCHVGRSDFSPFQYFFWTTPFHKTVRQYVAVNSDKSLDSQV